MYSMSYDRFVSPFVQRRREMGHPMANQGSSTADPMQTQPYFFQPDSAPTHLPPCPTLSVYIQPIFKQEVTSQDESFMLSLDGFIIKIDAMCT